MTKHQKDASDDPADSGSVANKEESFLGGGGDMAHLIRAYDWSKTPLGPIHTWSGSMKTAVSIALHSPVPIVMLWGKDGTMIYNDAYSEFAGARHPALLGSAVEEGWPEAAEFNRNVLKQGFKGKTLSYKDLTLTLYRSGNAEDVTMDLNYSPVMDESGKPAGVMAIVVETTARVQAEKNQKEAEEALKTERNRLYELFTQAPAAVAVLKGPHHVFELANPRYMKLIGRKRSVVGKTVADCLPEVKDQGFFELLDNVYQTGKPYIGNETQVKFDRNGDGELDEAFVNFIYQPHLDRSGAVQGILVHAVDVTEQVRARQKVEESERRLRFMAESMPQKIFTSKADGMVTYLNPQWMKYSGLTAAKIKAEGWLQLVHPDDAADNLDRWQYSLDTGEPFTFEQRLRRADGNYRWHVTRAHAMRGDNGDIIMWIGSNTDIHVIRLAIEREHRWETKAASLYEQRKELIELNKAKDEFLSLASHQLRTPATAVKQYLGMVLEGYFGDVPKTQLTPLLHANDNNERQLAIVNDLLRVARIDAGKVKLSRERISLLPLVEEVTKDLDATFGGRSQNIVVSHDTNEIRVMADPAKLRMVLENLLDNASKYSPEKTTTEVRVYVADDHVKIAVKDEGFGIRQEDVEKLFRKFSRLDNPLSIAVGGNGLGLYWAKKVIDLHGGSIDVESVPGKGSVFTVSLPI